MRKTALTYASREEIEVDLQCIEGVVPTDMDGFVFINSPVGTVNSSTPIPKKNPDGTDNPEWGQMVFNGDGMLFRFDCSVPGKVRVKSALLKTPCYYADEASKWGTDNYENGIFFKSKGIARTSPILGSRNQANTSIAAFKFPGNQHTRITVNFDAGRPFEVDPKTMKVITAIGYNKEWSESLSFVIQEDVFELIQSSAHPCYDPVTQEFFTVCFRKNMNNLIFTSIFSLDLTRIWHITNRFFKKVYRFLQSLMRWIGKLMRGVVRAFMGFVFPAYLQQLKADDTSPNEEKQEDIFGMVNSVSILKWTGKGKLQSWNIVGPKGKNLVIHQTMHQTALSKDFIILVDSSLKFALDIMTNMPFPKYPLLNNIIRWCVAKAMEPNTPLYLVKRADLVTGVTDVKARKVMVDLETVHYSVEYENPNNDITIYTSHNAASCAAEWVRPYDTLAIDPTKPVLENTIGLMASGEMDIGRAGKFVINGITGVKQEAVKIWQKGFEGDDPTQLKEAHTWAVGLNTFRDMASADTPTNTIPYIFWQSYGLDYRLLTTFIRKMYGKYQHRKIPVKKMLEYTKKGVPFCLSRMNTATMEFEDWFHFEMNQNLRSLQFVPKKNASPNLPPELNGYILCTMVNGTQDLEANDYTREVWFFDAANLKQGPVCKMAHDALQFAFTIHSVWISDCEPSPADYIVDPIEDYTEVLNRFTNLEKKELLEKFMKKEVFPHYQ
jgi:hypothetical protein